MARNRLAILHPGAMGAAVAACLVGRGHEVGWLRRAVAKRHCAAPSSPD
jgi:3-hydroxyisobutyrate dehydrogenase-like beta-hydroxyacid dehydrogenase